MVTYMMESRNSADYIIETFSHDDLYDQDARLALEKRYSNLIEPTEKFNRQIVSYQGNKHETPYNWFRYKEGFSSALVEILIDKFGLKSGDTIMDPFMGSGTTSLVAQRHGINSIGYDILSVSKLAFDVKLNAADYNITDLSNLLNDIKRLHFPNSVKTKFNYIPITKGAFPDATEAHISFLTEWVKKSGYADKVKNLAIFLLMSLLEELSYTRKDGQYLRWDHRSHKVIEWNKRRIAKGAKPIKTILDKGNLPQLKEKMLELLPKINSDIKTVKQDLVHLPKSKHELILGSVLYELPKYKLNNIDCVITSPPYCNRYDYTRTYALELAYLGINEDQIRSLRQNLLTSTVENKSKIKDLQNFYESIGASEIFSEVMKLVNENPSLQEVLQALRKRNERGEINNEGVIRMVDGYFTELAFVFRELYRVSKKGAHTVFVNDNVRYAGEIIPVDFIMTELAESFGFTPLKIYVLPQMKGNSSQQMKKFGRAKLRKSITVWKK